MNTRARFGLCGLVVACAVITGAAVAATTVVAPLASPGASDSVPPPVPGFPVGRCVRVLDVTAPEEAKQVGFEYLEVALQDLLRLPEPEFEGVVERLRRNGLRALSGYGFLPGDLKLVGPEADRARIEPAVRHGLARAARLGLSMVVLGNLNDGSRRAPAGFSPEEARRQLVEFGRFAARAADKHGITVLVEPLPRHLTNTINTVSDGLALVRAVNHPRLQLLVDYSYMVLSGEDVSALAGAARHVRQVEISNPNGRVYPRSDSESDYASFFRALRRGGYRGGISVHGKPSDFFADAPRAIALVRRLAAASEEAALPVHRRIDYDLAYSRGR